MIEVKIKEACLSRGIETAYRLQVEGGFAPTLASDLFHHRFKQLSLLTLNRLCQVLGCTPGHLLRFVPDEKVAESKVLGRRRRVGPRALKQNAV